MSNQNKQQKFSKKWLLLILLLPVLFCGWKIFGPTLKNENDKNYLVIDATDNYEKVKTKLTIGNFNASNFWFNFVSKRLSYSKIKPGRYEIKNNSSIYSLVKNLRAGNQVPVKFVINKFRTHEEFAGKLKQLFNADSIEVLKLIGYKEYLKELNIDSANFLSTIIPNTYNINWGASPRDIINRLYKEKEKFWNTERKNKAAALNFSLNEISVIASIVEEETNLDSEKGKVASVYRNRLKINMPLQADPTIKFAMKDFAKSKIFFNDLKFVSPYNTYLNTKIPPGPICTPSIKTLDAVLNMPETKDIYFVAEPNFSGKSYFSETYQQHQEKAKLYSVWIDSLEKAKALKRKTTIP